MEINGQFHAALTSSFPLGEKARGSQCTGVRMGSRIDLDVLLTVGN
jgi:hypothetical protein